MKGEELGVIFGRSDAEDLVKMLTEWRQQTNRGPHSPNPILPQAPDVYIAKAPAGGIPAKIDEPGTGTDSSIADLNYADCALYRIAHNTSSDIEIEPLGITKPVYNVGTTAVSGGSIFLAVRDKPGKYIAVELSDNCRWIQLTEEGTGGAGTYGRYSWREMQEDSEGGFEVLTGGATGNLGANDAARCTSLKSAVPLGIVVKACPGSTDSFMWFTTPDLDQDILCLASVTSGESGTGGNACLLNGESQALPDEWAEGVVTKYNPGDDTWHRKEDCWLKHGNNLALVSGQRYRGHLCGYNVCGEQVYTTYDCCDVPGNPNEGDVPETPGTGTNSGTGTWAETHDWWIGSQPPSITITRIQTVCCPADPVNRTLYATISAPGTTWDGQVVTMTYGTGDGEVYPSDCVGHAWATNNHWFGQLNVACGTRGGLRIALGCCNDGTWRYGFSANLSGDPACTDVDDETCSPLLTSQCTPFVITLNDVKCTVTDSCNCLAGVTIDIVITET